jgi:hypothetical protein
MKAHPEQTTSTHFHTVAAVSACFLGLGLGAGCKKSEPTVAATPQVAAATPAAADGGAEAEVETFAVEGFDPVAVCGAALDAESIPPVEVIGQLPDKEGVLARFEAVDGRFERSAQRAALYLSGEKLTECSVFAKDGSVPKSVRFTAATTTLEIGSWSWPSADGRWRRWYHVAMSSGRPWTNHGTADDKGLLIVDEVDETKRRVKGRLILCRAAGAGWLAGTFDVSLCDK